MEPEKTLNHLYVKALLDRINKPLIIQKHLDEEAQYKRSGMTRLDRFLYYKLKFRKVLSKYAVQYDNNIRYLYKGKKIIKFGYLENNPVPFVGYRNREHR